MNINASIVGANGYTGLELMNILANHPNVTLNKLISRSNDGRPVSELYPSLLGKVDKCFSNDSFEEIAKGSDIVFLALPHGESAVMAGKFFDAGIKVVDLSADFRYKDIQKYNAVYKIAHPRPDLAAYCVYGLCEIYKDDIKKAALVANPGCYTTCSIMALYPLLQKEAISGNNIIIDAKSGISGAGRKAAIDYIMTESAENFKAYSLTNHRHTSEIEERLSEAYGQNIALSFSPHLLPIKRGILSTIYCELTDFDADIAAIYNDFYKNQPFVQILPENKLPEIKNVAGSNNIQIGFIKDKRLNRLIVVSCLDNLVKGASGQAVQNMNIMFGLDQTVGLNFVARYI
jgi:N-acetyl-gamma-glutamyl-phosphate reductase